MSNLSIQKKRYNHLILIECQRENTLLYKKIKI